MAKQRFGQHFLINQAVARREVTYAQITPDDVVLEIGPGKGALTQLLAQHASSVLAIEIDAHLIAALQPTLPSNVTLIPGDAVTIDFSSLPRFTKVVSNLPFQISSPITFKLLSTSFSRAVLIYQKDFAERLVAHPGSKQYSRLTVGVAYKAHCRILEEVPRTCFSPVPKVDCCIVELILRDTPLFVVHNEAFFFRLTAELFSHRRKKIRSVLKGYVSSYDQLPYLDQRVEQLTPQQIGELCNLIAPSP
ncbi:MAG: ribosomal RNA small subunit methyltransferase A [Candidatus Thermoplasmatota archaeon]|nr:ribosomal RNA small subunit methyltransferase A [Candidatus Thermoplasmatota archaeon]